MDKELVRIILSLLFFSWLVYAIIIMRVTNRKYKEIANNHNMSNDDFLIAKKKLRKKHIIKVLNGLFMFIVVLLILIFINS